MRKTFEKQTKTIEDQGKKQIDALADLKPKEVKPGETKPNEYGDYFLNPILNGLFYGRSMSGGEGNYPPPPTPG